MQAEIDEALAGKKYKLCDELNADLQELQASLASMPTVAAGKLNYSYDLKTRHLLSGDNI